MLSSPSRREYLQDIYEEYYQASRTAKNRLLTEAEKRTGLKGKVLTRKLSPKRTFQQQPRKKRAAPYSGGGKEKTTRRIRWSDTREPLSLPPTDQRLTQCATEEENPVSHSPAQESLTRSRVPVACPYARLANRGDKKRLRLPKVPPRFGIRVSVHLLQRNTGVSVGNCQRAPHVKSRCWNRTKFLYGTPVPCCGSEELASRLREEKPEFVRNVTAELGFMWSKLPGMLREDTRLASRSKVSQDHGFKKQHLRFRLGLKWHGPPQKSSAFEPALHGADVSLIARALRATEVRFHADRDVIRCGTCFKHHSGTCKQPHARMCPMSSFHAENRVLQYDAPECQICGHGFPLKGRCTRKIMSNTLSA